MNEEISIIDSNTRNEKIKNFFNNNKKPLIAILTLIILIAFSYFAYNEIQEKKNKNLADKYNSIIVNFNNSNKTNIKNELIEIIYEKNSTYSPLALYFLIDNNIINENNKINELFDIVINETSLEEEIKNLVIYKKALFNSDFESENNLIQILSPVINSDSVWKSHALYLMAEYFYYKNQKQKSKDFFNQILTLENSNPNIKIETQKRLNRDFSD